MCPDCQSGSEWLAELDHCERCASEQLSRILGETICRSCGHTPAGARRTDAAPPAQRSAPSSAPGAVGLSAEVAAALDRMFHRR